MKRVRRTGTLVASAAGVLLMASCGSTDGPAPSPSPPGVGATINITSSGVTPKSLVVSAGVQVTFVNNDSRDHQMNSDPHPEHNDCPAINNVGFLVPGQSKQTGNLTEVRTCGFHDHMRPENASLRGTITIQ